MAAICPLAIAAGIDVKNALVIVETDAGAGTGFIATLNGTKYIISNRHLLEGARQYSFKTASGTVLQPLRLEIAKDRDVARITIKDLNSEGLVVDDSNVAIGQRIVVYGNSMGESVITETTGDIIGVGPSTLEVSALFVAGNSGSPIIDARNNVVGVATYMVQSDKDEFILDTRYEKPRRYATRIPYDAEDIWIPVSTRMLYEQSTTLDDIETLFLHFYFLQPLMVTEKTRTTERVYSKLFEIRETKWNQIGYKPEARTYFHADKWYLLLKRLCDAHDTATASLYERARARRSFQVTTSLNDLQRCLKSVSSEPRQVLKSTSWLPPYAGRVDALLDMIPIIEGKAKIVSEHFGSKWN